MMKSISHDITRTQFLIYDLTLKFLSKKTSKILKLLLTIFGIGLEKTSSTS